VELVKSESYPLLYRGRREVGELGDSDSDILPASELLVKKFERSSYTACSEDVLERLRGTSFQLGGSW
jgi:hypothetical protein